MLTDKEKEIALEVAHRSAKTYRHGADEPYSFDDGCMIHAFDLFLSRIREEQEPYATLQWGSSRFIECIYRGMLLPIDPLSLEKEHRPDRYTPIKLFTTPPAAPECNCEELVLVIKAYMEAGVGNSTDFEQQYKARVMAVEAIAKRQQKGEE